MIGGIALNTKHKIILLLTFLTSFFLTGCGKDAELENYKANMNQFFENINSETAVSDLLSLLDSMNTSFEQMASLDVPDGFPGVDELADEASEYMSEAVSYYHQAYENGYNANLEDAARQYYESANVRFQYIVSILHGDIPEEIYTYEDETSSEDTAESNDAAFESE